MTIKNRINKLEHRDQEQEPLVGGLTQAEWELIRAERFRLLNDPETLDRISNDAMRADGYKPLPPRQT